MRKKIVSLWLPVLLYTGLIFWISSRPRPIPGITFWDRMDKVWHFVEYIPLGWLMLRALVRSVGSWTYGLSLAAAGLALAIGFLDEYYQTFIPMKNPSFWDSAADGLGAAVGIWIYWRMKVRVPATP